MSALALAALLLDAGVPQTNPFAEAEANAARIQSPAAAHRQPEPAYSKADKAAGKRGNVFVRAVIGTDGTVLAAQVVRSSAPPELDQAALEAIRALRYQPARDADRNPLVALVETKVVFATSKLDPDLETRVDRVYDPAERALGHFGKVLISAEVGADGRLISPVIESSSLAPALDAEAMRAATTSLYRPYRDAAGKPVNAPIKVAYDFDSYTSPGEGGGVLRYSCDQFARDHIWWKSAHGPKKRSDLYHMMLGLGTILSDALSNPDRMVEFDRAFEGRWNKAIRACKAKPDKLFIDILKPEGEFARSMFSMKVRDPDADQ